MCSVSEVLEVWPAAMSAQHSKMAAGANVDVSGWSDAVRMLSDEIVHHLRNDLITQSFHFGGSKSSIDEVSSTNSVSRSRGRATCGGREATLVPRNFAASGPAAGPQQHCVCCWNEIDKLSNRCQQDAGCQQFELL